MAERDQILRRAARLSVGVGVLVLALKVGAWVVSDSTAVFSDAIESIVHLLATAMMLAMLQYSQKEPDEDHPYGHGKAGSFSVGFEGGLVALSGVLVLVTVIERLLNGHQIADLTFGILGTLAATAVNLALGLHLVRIGRRERSEILVADGQHVLADVWTSAGVIAGLALAWITGLEWLDWAVAAVVGVHLLVVGSRLVRNGIAGLMDEVDEADYAAVVAAVNRVREPDWQDMHDLRLRRVGDLVHVDFHLVVPAEWTIARGHRVSALLEKTVLDELDSQGTVLVHLDHPGSVEGLELAAVGDGAFSVPAALRSDQSGRP